MSVRIIIDTREQLPYQIENSLTKTLKIGDYAPLGYENEMAVERKSFHDWVNSITRGRKRFEREILHAKRKLKFFAIVIETDFSKMWTEPIFNKRVSRKVIVNAVLYWSVKYNIPIFFASNRIQATYLVKELCEAYVNYRTSKKYHELFEEVYGTS